MKLSEIRTTLQKIRVSPVKTLGQNFLHDQNLARWIVTQAEIITDDYVVEIGPCLRALTMAVYVTKGDGATSFSVTIYSRLRLPDFARSIALLRPISALDSGNRFLSKTRSRFGTRANLTSRPARLTRAR